MLTTSLAVYFNHSDLEHGSECVRNCRQMDHSDCACSDNDHTCHINCAGQLAQCIQQCPCQKECPLGCDSCTSSFCQCKVNTSDEKAQCEDELSQIYVECIIACEGDNVCMSECTRIYNEQLAFCPCNENCPNGCPCPSYECPDQISSTTSVATTTTEIAKKNTAVLVLNTSALSKPPMLIDVNGQGGDLANFEYGESEVYKSCSIVFNGRAYVFGGWRQNQKQRQVCVIDECRLTRIASLDFDFELGACASTDMAIYLCFDYYTSETRTCRSGEIPTGPFSLTSNSSFDHSIIQMAAGPCESEMKTKLCLQKQLV